MADAREDLPETPRPPEPRLDRIGAKLRDAYAEAASEPLPQAFEELLSQLR